MEYKVLSKEDVLSFSKELAEKIKESFEPDYIIFVERGSLYIGQEVANFFGCPLLSVSATRTKSTIKKIVSPLLKIIPSSFKKFLRETEIKSNVHDKNCNRNVELYFDKDLNNKKVVLVDDSVDTGYSILEIIKKINNLYPNVIMKTASFNILDRSKKTINIDYYLMENTMLSGPWSNDSKYYKQFLEDFQSYKKKVSNHE